MLCCLRHWTWQIQRSTRAIFHCTTVLCLVTPSTMVCSGFTATRFLQSRFMAVTAWTSSWFGPRVSTMEPLWCRQIQFGMHWFCSFSQPHHKPTPGPKRLTVHSFHRWKHTTILPVKMVIIINIVNIDIIFNNIDIIFIAVVLLYLLYLLYLL